MRKNFLLLAGSVVFAFLLAELALRLHPPVMVYMVTRNIVQQTHSEPSPDPVLGYIPRANLSKDFSNLEFHTHVTINSKNMRDREYSFEKPAGIKRIAVAGDSFVFGWGVEDREVFTEILEDRYLKNTEVLNFGVSGYDAAQTLERIKVEALRFHPDAVLLCLYGFPDGAPPQQYEFRDGRLYYAQKEKVTGKDKIKNFLRRNVYLFTVLEDAKGWLETKFSPPAQPPAAEPYPSPAEWQFGLRILSDFQEMGQQNGFKPIVIYIPNKWDLLDPSALKDDMKGIQLLSEFSEGTGLTFWNLTPELTQAWKKSGRLPYFKFDDHWNTWGHETAAYVIAERLKKEGF